MTGIRRLGTTNADGPGGDTVAARGSDEFHAGDLKNLQRLGRLSGHRPQQDLAHGAAGFPQILEHRVDARSHQVEDCRGPLGDKVDVGAQPEPAVRNGGKRPDRGDLADADDPVRAVRRSQRERGVATRLGTPVSFASSVL